MNFNLKKPCAMCPFRHDIEPFLTTGHADNIVESLVDSQGTFPCHKTIDYSEGGEGVETPKTEHCAGALIMLEHMEQPNQLMRIAERIGLYDRTTLIMDSPVFTDGYGFIEAQER